MAKVNTEKPAGKDQGKKMESPKKTKKESLEKAPVKKEEVKKVETLKSEEKTEKTEEKKPEEKKTELKEEIKKPSPKKVKKSETSVNVQNLSISYKVAASICKFLKNKRLEIALKEMEEVVKMKKAIPMKGEYAHRKGKIMSGKYPVKAAKEFVVLLKSLEGNANNHDIENPVITEAFSNKGPTIYTSGGKTRKRAHVRIVVKNKKIKEKKEKKK